MDIENCHQFSYYEKDDLHQCEKCHKDQEVNTGTIVEVKKSYKRDCKNSMPKGARRGPLGARGAR